MQSNPPYSRSSSVHSSPGLTPQLHSIVARELYSTQQQFGPKVAVIVSGLPARGKSYICTKLKRYLNWMGLRTKVFNVGTRRRLAPGSEHHDAKFFDPLNQDAREQRNQFALEVMQEMLGWLRREGKIAIHDATNSTVERRHMLVRLIKETFSEDEVVPVIIESQCTDQLIIDANVRMKVHSPDYTNIPAEKAIEDFYQRLKNYEKAYEPVGPAEERDQVSYILIENVGKKVTAFNIHGYYESQMVFYLMNIHVGSRTIWLTSHGESAPLIADGSLSLTDSGRKYAAALSRFMEERFPTVRALPPLDGQASDSKPTGSRDSIASSDSSPGHHLEVWTSMLRRSIEMAEYLSPAYTYKHSNILNELYANEFERVAQARDDLDQQTYTALFVERLRPLIIELERVRHSVLIVARSIVLSLLYAYFFEMPTKEAMYRVRIPENTILCLKPMPFGTEVSCYEYDFVRDQFVKTPQRSFLGTAERHASI